MTRQNISPLSISCIIPNKNRRELAARAVESIIKQEIPSYIKDVELILVDDNSSDNSEEFLQKKFPDLKIVKTAGVGAGPARNAGARAAKGDILFFLDSDDIWRSEHIKKLMPSFFKGADSACSRVYNHNLIDGRDFLIPDQGIDLSFNPFLRLKRWCDIIPSSFAIRKEIFFKIKGFPDIKRGEDWLFFLKLTANYNLSFIPEISVERYLHKESLSAEKKIKENILNMLDDILREFKDDKFKSEDRLYLEKLKKLSIEKGDKWKSIQDFYIAAREAGLTAL